MAAERLDEATLTAIDERLRACRMFLDAAVFQQANELIAVVRPDLPEIWAAGTGNVRTLVQVKVAEVARALPDGHAIVDFAITRQALPRGADGTLMRSALAQLYQTGTEAAGIAAEPPTADKTGRTVWEFLQRRFPDRQLHPDDCPRLELGLDSLDWLELLIELEAETGIALSESRASRIITLGDLLEACRHSVAHVAELEPSLGQLRARLMQGPEQCEWLRHRRPALLAMTRAVFRLNRLVLRLAFRLKVDGLEHLPQAGPAVVAPNHSSDLDVPIMMAALPQRILPILCWGGNKERLFATPVSRFFCRGGHVLPLDDRIPVVGLAGGLASLRAGRILVWFPEGWRSPNGEVQAVQRGIGWLTALADVPVVPARIDGSFEAWPRTRRWPRPHPIRVAFGAPIIPAELAARGAGGDTYAGIADGVRRSLVAMRAPLHSDRRVGSDLPVDG